MPSSNEAKARIAVLGGGITGLAVAYTLARAREGGAPFEELLIEADGRLGGSILTECIEGFVVEAGPDSFLAEKPEAAALCRELGLADSLIGSNDRERRTYILHRGRLVPLPDGMMLLVPTRLWPIVRTPLLPLTSKLALAAEWFMSPAAGNFERAGGGHTADESVASFVRRHFGDAMLEKVADPLLAAVFGGDTARLSVRSVLPRFQEMEQRYGSLTRAVLEMRRQRRRQRARSPRAVLDSSPPLFMTLKEGLGHLVVRLSERLANSRLHLDERVVGLEPVSARGRNSATQATPQYKIHCEGGRSYEAGAVILALPAHACSRLLSSMDAGLSTTLAEIPYSSGLTVALGYDAAVARQLPPGFGFLAPRTEARRLVACTFMHQKFLQRAPEGHALLRCFLGGTRDSEVLGLGDAEIVSLVRQELAQILEFSAEPEFVRVYRWPSSMPQYVLGHEARVAAIENQLAKHPGLFIAGNAYSGIGISDCIRTARTAAARAQNLCASR